MSVLDAPVHRYEPLPPPRWAVVAAHAVPLCTVPSALWRIAAWLGVIPGARATSDPFDTVTGIYILVLTVVIEALALLTLGLVRPWGQRFPRGLVLSLATAGAVGLFLLPAVGPVLKATHVHPPQLGDDTGNLPAGGPGLWITVAAYLPLIAWPPLLAAVTWSFRQRTRRTPARVT